MFPQYEHSVYLLIYLLTTKKLSVQSTEKQSKQCLLQAEGKWELRCFCASILQQTLLLLELEVSRWPPTTTQLCEQFTQGSPWDIPARSTEWERKLQILKTKQNFLKVWFNFCPVLKRWMSQPPFSLLQCFFHTFLSSITTTNHWTNAAMLLLDLHQQMCLGICAPGISQEQRNAPSPFHFIFTHLTLPSTSKICVFTEPFSDKKTLQGRCLTFAFIYTTFFTGTSFFS